MADPASLLSHLQREHAFDPTPLRAALGCLHVPFDELTPPGRVEARLLDATRRGGRVAIVGESGCGKSSVAWHVLGPGVEGLAPIQVPVAVMPPLDTCIEVPRVEQRAGLVRVLNRRVEWFTDETAFEGARAGDVFEDAALDALSRWYDRDRPRPQVRDAVRAAHVALTEACDAGSERVTAPSLRVAMAAL